MSTTPIQAESENLKKRGREESEETADGELVPGDDDEERTASRVAAKKARVCSEGEIPTAKQLKLIEAYYNVYKANENEREGISAVEFIWKHGRPPPRKNCFGKKSLIEAALIKLDQDAYEEEEEEE